MIIAVTILLTLLSAAVVYANPVNTPFDSVGWLLPIFIVEAVIICALAGFRKIQLLRFAVVWVIINIGTFVLLLIIAILLSNLTNDIMGWIIGEVVIVILEALIMQRLLSSKTMTKEPIHLSARKALLISLIANAASLGLGFVLSKSPESMESILQIVSRC